MGEAHYMRWLIERRQLHMLSFKAVAVCATEMPDLGCFVIVLAEQPDGSGARLEIQRATSFDEQDRALGQDTYCLCDEGGSTHYGGVVSWRIAINMLEINLNSAAATALGAEGYTIELEISPEDYAKLKDGLQQALE